MGVLNSWWLWVRTTRFAFLQETFFYLFFLISFLTAASSILPQLTIVFDVEAHHHSDPD